MPVTISTFLRNTFYADALISGAAALLMVLGAPVLSPILGLPSGLLLGAGLLLVPFVAMLVVVARRESVPRLLLIDIIAINALWVLASFGLLFSGLVAPTALGMAFVAVQAVTVALFAEAQFVGMRRAVVASAA